MMGAATLLTAVGLIGGSWQYCQNGYGERDRTYEHMFMGVFVAGLGLGVLSMMVG